MTIQRLHLAVEVESIARPVDDVVELRLRPAGSGRLPAWRAGAHAELDLGGGRTRHYSLCGEVGDDVWTVAVLRQEGGRGGSAYIHDELAVGSRLLVRALGHRFDLPEAPAYLLVAGGIGVTPLISMAQEAERREVPWRMLAVGRGRERVSWLEGVAARWPGRVDVVDTAVAGRPDLDRWLQGAADRAPSVGPPAVMVCGPESLVSAVRDQSVQRGWEVRTEAFGGEVASTRYAAGGSFEVELAATGRTIQVPADKSILEVAQEAGAVVLSSCREGYCGTCETVVLEGEVDHRDTALSPEDQADGDVMMICVSRCRGGRLVLDL